MSSPTLIFVNKHLFHDYHFNFATGESYLATPIDNASGQENECVCEPPVHRGAVLTSGVCCRSSHLPSLLCNGLWTLCLCKVQTFRAKINSSRGGKGRKKHDPWLDADIHSCVSRPAAAANLLQHSMYSTCKSFDADEFAGILPGDLDPCSNALHTALHTREGRLGRGCGSHRHLIM